MDAIHVRCGMRWGADLGSERRDRLPGRQTRRPDRIGYIVTRVRHRGTCSPSTGTFQVAPRRGHASTAALRRTTSTSTVGSSCKDNR